VTSLRTVLARVRAVNDRLQATKPLRAWNRLNDARGGILAGGIAYFGFFSLVPVLTVGFTGFGYVLGGNAPLQQQVAQRVNASLGITLIGTRPGQGAVQLSRLVQDRTLTLTGGVALVVLVIAGLGWLQATREGIRAVFGIPVLTDPVLARIRDVASLGLLGLAVVASLVAGVVVGTAAGAVSGWLGWDGTPLAEGTVWLGSSLVLIAVDTLIFLLFLTVLSGVPVPVADLRFGAFLAAGGMQLLKLSAGLLAHRLSRNPLLASSVVLVGLLVWMNVAARLTLFGAAWAAVTAVDRGHLDTASRPAGGPGATRGTGHGTMGPDARRPPGRMREGETAMTVRQPGSRTAGGAARAGRAARRTGRTRPSPYARHGEPMPVTFGQRSADRVTLAAGIVLGAGALIAARAVRRALAALRDVDRG
jgi:membrane protein